MTKIAFDKIAEGLREAIALARGKKVSFKGPLKISLEAIFAPAPSRSQKRKAAARGRRRRAYRPLTDDELRPNRDWFISNSAS